MLFIAVVTGFFVANLLGIALIKILFGFSLTDLAGVIQDPENYPGGKAAVVLFQGLSHLVAFTVAPLILLQVLGYRPMRLLSPKVLPPLALLLLSGLVLLVVMPANSWLIEWNSKMHFPEFLRGFEAWAKAKEEELRVLTQLLTRFNSGGEFLVGMLVFALIPAFGEEVVFRGILQQSLQRWWRNPHVAIWVTAFIFGAIHMQFYGFFPRMLLGAVMGYLYFWSGNLWVPVLGHFVNNGFTVFMLYLQQLKFTDVDVESTDSLPLPAILVSLAASLALLYWLRPQLQAVPEKENPEPESY